MAVRAVVAVVAILVVAWSAVLLRDTRLQDRATALAQSSRDPATLERTARDFEAASLLNPDTAPAVGRAVALGRGPEAVGVLEDVVRREPENLTAWRLLAALTKELDPARSRQAVARARALDPQGSP